MTQVMQYYTETKFLTKLMELFLVHGFKSNKGVDLLSTFGVISKIAYYNIWTRCNGKQYLFLSLIKVSFNFVPRVFYLGHYKTLIIHSITSVVPPTFTGKLHTFSVLILNYNVALGHPQYVW